MTKWVGIYKKYRDIIISDIVHIRRPDGQALDSFMHANAFLPVNKGFALVFNPTLQPLTQNLTFPLYYTGLESTAVFSWEGGAGVAMQVARDYTVTMSVSVPAQGVTWCVITAQ